MRRLKHSARGLWHMIFWRGSTVLSWLGCGHLKVDIMFSFSILVANVMKKMSKSETNLTWVFRLQRSTQRVFKRRDERGTQTRALSCHNNDPLYPRHATPWHPDSKPPLFFKNISLSVHVDGDTGNPPPWARLFVRLPLVPPHAAPVVLSQVNCNHVIKTSTPLPP